MQRHNNRASLSEWFMILAGAHNIHDDNNLIYNIYISGISRFTMYS